jgi:hypothetical protein
MHSVLTDRNPKRTIMFYTGSSMKIPACTINHSALHSAIKV